MKFKQEQFSFAWNQKLSFKKLQNKSLLFPGHLQLKKETQKQFWKVL